MSDNKELENEMLFFMRLEKDTEKLGFEKRVISKIKQVKKDFQNQHLKYNELLDYAASTYVYLGLSTATNHRLLAENTNLKLHNQDSSHSKQKKALTTKIISLFHVNSGQILKESRTKNASAGGKGKIEKDSTGKAKAKNEVKCYWDRWQNEPHLYKTIAGFARDMLEKHSALESHKTIENWCRGWKNEKPVSC